MVRRGGEVALEQSRVPIGWIFGLLSAAGGALILSVTVGLYAGRIETKALAASDRAAAAEKEAASATDFMHSIDRRLSRIEGALGVRSERGPERRK